MFKHKRTTLERIDKFISPLYFTDVNLYGKLYPEKLPLESLEHVDCGLNRPSFEDVVLHQKYGSFSKVSVGQPFGPTWSTHWFKISVRIPEQKWAGQEVHLRWDSDSEAMIWSNDGVPLQGLSGGVHERTDYILTSCCQSNDRKNGQVFYVEMACNNAFGAGKDSMIGPPDPGKSYTLKMAEIAAFDRKVYSLLLSLKCLHDIANELPETNPRSFDALYAGNDIINAIQNNPGLKGMEEAQSIAKSFFSKRNGETQHQIVAVGHCHIDCAWLWTYDETIRKCARSWSSTLRLMEKYPDFNFACSQAQQFQWVKDNYPKLYEEIKAQVKNGRFIPVGGTWVEMDGNLPSGESFIRQFLYGQTFFRQEFGEICQEFWLPDTFGYSAQLPQIMRQCGINRFLTQKISWSLVNKFPHHNFIWEGIDGSSVIAHFPPGDSYEMKVEVKEALKQVSNLQDKGRVNESLMLFGYGDGGGGPIEDMITRQGILKDVDGIPKIKMGRPSEVFEHLESRKDKLCTWKGELYLELHNGTYTSQADMKELNRKCEFSLRDLEFLVSIVQTECPSDEYPEIKRDIDDIWKKVLLNQFHDVLPGSSISLVHQEAKKLFQSCLQQLDQMKKKILSFLGEMVLKKSEGQIKDAKTLAIFNTLPWTSSRIISVPASILSDSNKKFLEILQNQILKDEILIPVKVPSMGYSLLHKSVIPDFNIVTLEKTGTQFTLKNKYLSATIDQYGRLVSLKCLESGREAITSGSWGNHLVIFDDIPLYWDAWDVMDYHLETRKDIVNSKDSCLMPVVEESGPLRVKLSYSIKFGDKSHLKQEISLDATSKYLRFDTQVDWHESHKFLKVEFPVNIHSQNATYEIQYGHLERPTHYNTSWDWARFEVCGHKWVDMSEYGFGVALLNNSKYGYSVRGNIMSLSLLRSPKSPDENADMGKHSFTYAIMPHKGTFQEAGVINQAYELNSEPLVTETRSDCGGKSWFEICNPAVILETLKVSESNSNELILRFYESYGSHCETVVRSPICAKELVYCDALERVLSTNPIEIRSLEPRLEFQLSFTPFQIVTVKVCLV